MTYAELLQKLSLAGFDRIERDDRLHDIFPHESREKGVELWELWGDETVRILKIRLPYDEKKLVLYELFRSQLEHLLQSNTPAKLEDFERAAKGTDAVSHL